MKNNIAKFRAALEMARDYITSDLASERGAFEGYEGVSRIDEIKADLANNVAALAALAELEKAAAEPVATLVGFDVETGLPADIAWHADCAAFNSGDKLYTVPPPAPVAEIREVVVTDEMGKKVYEKWVCLPRRIGCSFAVSHGIDMIAAVRAELGPALGLVELKEPTPEECRDIWREAKANEGDGSKVCAGRAMFAACRAVMWPKEGL